MPPANAETILAFDVGLKRTGVAVGSAHTANATPEATIAGKDGQLDWSHLENLLNTWQPQVCVVGDPKTDNPHLNKLIRRLVHRLQAQQIKVVMVNEALTSEHANSILAEAEFSSQKKQSIRDQVAASLILERYLNGLDSI